MRLSELVNLRIENINLSSLAIHLTYTKTHRDRTVFILQKTSDILTEYIKLLNRKNGDKLAQPSAYKTERTWNLSVKHVVIQIYKPHKNTYILRGKI